ncbi:MotA/TolQ/ExbB proton channel family protein [Maioricimonas sp. JC845]|uniref:MotA/TolQ/ExbB proton channel family protein n=1 Tax=Maioricimonas sp. JC845 TaxID=3232138 RepID=UPI00345A540A
MTGPYPVDGVWTRRLTTTVCLAALFCLVGPLSHVVGDDDVSAVSGDGPTVAVPAEAGPEELAEIPASPAGDGPDAATTDDESALPTNIIEIVRSLEYWIIPFALATLIALWFTTERMVVLRRGRVIPKPFVQRFLKLLEEGELERDEALQICEENNSPVANVFEHGIRKWAKPSVEVEQAIIDGGERQVSALRKHLRVINGVATVTPLIGLLGTVWGMLQAFNDIAAAGAMGRTEQLASGIALALVTTAAGLVIAIPSLIAYMYLSGRVDSLVMDMDELAQRVVQCVSAESLAEQGSRPRKAAGTGKAPQKKAV